MTEQDVDQLLSIKTSPNFGYFHKLMFEETRVREWGITDALVQRILASNPQGPAGVAPGSSAGGNATLEAVPGWFRPGHIASGPAEQDWKDFFDQNIKGKWRSPKTRKAFSTAAEAWRDLN